MKCAEINSVQAVGKMQLVFLILHKDVQHTELTVSLTNTFPTPPKNKSWKNLQEEPQRRDPSLRTDGRTWNRCCTYRMNSGITVNKEIRGGGWEQPLSRRDAALTSQRQFVISPPLVVHTDWSTAGVKTNCLVILTESCAAAPKETWRYTSWWWRRGVSQVSPLSI